MHTLYTATKNFVQLIFVHNCAYEKFLTTKISRTTVCDNGPVGLKFRGNNFWLFKVDPQKQQNLIPSKVSRYMLCYFFFVYLFQALVDQKPVRRLTFFEGQTFLLPKENYKVKCYIHVLNVPFQYFHSTNI